MRSFEIEFKEFGLVADSRIRTSNLFWLTSSILDQSPIYRAFTLR
jgi:hypothetical protein